MRSLITLCICIAATIGCVDLQRDRSQQHPSPALQVVYGPAGLQQLRYEGTTLEDVDRFPKDRCHIGHMKMTDLQGRLIAAPQYGWGENSGGRFWDPALHRWTYEYVWGSIQIQYVVAADRLDVTVTERNRAGSGAVLEGAVIYPLALHLPRLPAAFQNASYPQLAFTELAPGAVVVDYGTAEAVSVVPDAGRPLYGGFWPTGDSMAYTAMVASTSPDGLPAFQPHFDRRVQPGETDSFTMSIRFVPSGTAAAVAAADAFTSFSKTYPSQLEWPDRRPIGTAYLASSPPAGAADQPGGFPNPRRYFNDDYSGEFDIRTASGLRAFQLRVLDQARQTVVQLRALRAQGVVTWDLEGEQYPQATSYVCSPDSLAQSAPEMESTITDVAPGMRGMKLADAYFKTISDAGFLIGVCVRPQHFTHRADGTASQATLHSDDEMRDELARKIEYAHRRWGARLFYVDSSVNAAGGALDPAIFERLHQRFPDCLLMPEQATPRHYAYSAPFLSFLFHGETGTPPWVRALYPGAFSTILINDAANSSLLAAEKELTVSAKAGDVLMGHAGYPDPNNATIRAIMQTASADKTPEPMRAAGPKVHTAGPQVRKSPSSE